MTQVGMDARLEQEAADAKEAELISVDQICGERVEDSPDSISSGTKRSRKSKNEPSNGEAPKKKSKTDEMIQRYQDFAKVNDKYLKTEVKIEKNLFAKYKKDLENPHIMKGLALPAFYFLDKYSITATNVIDTDHLYIETHDVKDRIKQLKKTKEFSPETIALFEKKFDRKLWKLPAHDKQKVLDLFHANGQVTVVLQDIHLSKFDSQDESGVVVWLKPSFRYE